MQDWQLIVASIFGGSGVIAAIIKLIELKRTGDAGELEREDTVITRWQGIAKRAETAERLAERREAWFREHFYIARDRLPREDRVDLPTGPPADMY